MSKKALTIGPDGTQLLPVAPRDWDSWVSASSTRNYLTRNPLIDWLERYGEANGFFRDTDLDGYDARLEFVPFIMKKGHEFEAAIIEHLSSKLAIFTVAHSRDDVRDLAAAEGTFEPVGLVLGTWALRSGACLRPPRGGARPVERLGPRQTGVEADASGSLARSGSGLSENAGAPAGAR